MSRRYHSQFRNIEDVRSPARGRSRKGFDSAQDLLVQLGYLTSDICTPCQLDSVTQLALRKYQEFNGCPITETFDKATRDHMCLPRCGIADMLNGTEFSTKCSWKESEIRYAFGAGPSSLSDVAAFDAVRRAFDQWQDVAESVTFREVDLSDNPHVDIAWVSGNDSKFDSQGDVVAYADFPPGCSRNTPQDKIPKPIRFDDSDRNWSVDVDTDDEEFDVETVALHEIGHILGMDHVKLMGSVMRPEVHRGIPNRELSQDDIDGVQFLYPPRRRRDQLFARAAAEVSVNDVLRETFLRRIENVEHELEGLRKLVARL